MDKRPNSIRTNLLASCALILLVFSLYAPTLNNPLVVMDDKYLIKQNAFIQNPANLSKLFTTQYFSQKYELSFRPLGTLTLFMNHAIGGDNPFFYRLTNIILHSLNCVLLFFLCSMLLRQISGEGGKFTFRAFAVAAIFAVHPVNTEAINGATFMEDLLCLLFMLAGLMSYIKRRSGGGVMFGLAAAIFTALALLSKETAAVLLAVFFIYEITAVRAAGNKVDIRKTAVMLAPFLLIVLGYLYIRFFPMKNPAEQFVFHEHSGWATFLLTCQAWTEYLKLIFYPLVLCFDYLQKSSPSISQFTFAFSVFVTAAVLLLPVVLYRRNRFAAFGFAWHILFLLPVSNIIPIGVTMADRYLYIPLPGFLIALACLCPESKNRENENKSPDVRGSAKLLATIVTLTVIASLFYLSSERNKDWSDEIVFGAQTCACSPQSALPRINIGLAYRDAGQLPDAAVVLKQAVQLASTVEPTTDRYGTLYRALGNLGMVCAEMRQYRDAEYYLREAIRVNPNYSNARFNLGALYLKSRHPEILQAGLNEMETGLRIEPGNIQARRMLAQTYETIGNAALALKHYRILADTDLRNRDFYLSKVKGLFK